MVVGRATDELDVLRIGREYWDQWSARRAAIDTLSPYLQRTRAHLGEIPQIAWRDPYIVGFVTMIASLLILERSAGRISGEKLGLAQLAVWERVSGIVDPRVGEDILTLSAAGDELFLEGCRNARRFHGSLRKDLDQRDIEMTPEMLASLSATGRSSDSLTSTNELAPLLWDLFFESRLHPFFSR